MHAFIMHENAKSVIHPLQKCNANVLFTAFLKTASQYSNLVYVYISDELHQAGGLPETVGGTAVVGSHNKHSILFKVCKAVRIVRKVFEILIILKF